MNEHPVLFSTSMIKAIIEGNKSQTRRVVKGVDSSVEHLLPFARGNTRRMCGHDAGPFIKCPYGVPGDRLWVREAWRPLWDDADKPGGLGDCVQYRADMSKRKPLLKDIGFDDGMKFDEMCDESCPEPRWRPSIHMPRWASRITLEITGIKVERVKDISEADARAEGVEPNCPDRVTDLTCPSKPCESCDCRNEYRHYLRGDEDFPAFSARESFESLWDSINAARGYGWDVNPWVWCVSFRRVV